MISPEGFRELRKSALLSRRGCAEFLGCSVSTVRAWDRGRNRVPWSAVRLLRLLRLGDLGVLDDSWSDWSVLGDRLVSPEGLSFRASDMAWWSLTCRQAEGFRKAFDRWQRLSEVFRAALVPKGVAGVSPAADAFDPEGSGAPGVRGAVELDTPTALRRPSGELALAQGAAARSAAAPAGLVNKSTMQTRKAETEEECGLQRVDVEPKWGHNGATLKGGNHDRSAQTQPAAPGGVVHGSGSNGRGNGDQPQRVPDLGGSELGPVPAQELDAAARGGRINKAPSQCRPKRALPLRQRSQVEALPRQGVTANAVGGVGRA